MISPNFVRKATQKKKKQQKEEKLKNLEDCKNHKFRVAEKSFLFTFNFEVLEDF